MVFKMQGDSMRILLIWDTDYPWDIRIEKMCNTLLENNYEVHIVCRNSYGRPTDEFYNGLSIHRVTPLKRKYKYFNKLLGFPLFISPFWISKIIEIGKQYKVDLIIVRDLPLTLAGVIAAKWLKMPIIMDMAECYPEFVKLIWRFEKFRISNVMIRLPIVVDFVETIALKYVDHTFAVVDEAKERLVRKNVSPDKVSIVSNTPVWKRFQSADATFPGSLKSHKGKLILLYVGLVNYSRGLDTVLYALKEFLKIYDNIFLSVVGQGTALIDLKKIVEKLKLDAHVVFEGWVDNNFVPEYVASSDICLLPLHQCSHFENTIANKIFDYMAAGKPVLVSDMGPMKRIVEETNCGLIHVDNDINDFNNQLRKLLDSGARESFGLNGVNAVKNKYNWDIDSARMIESITRLIKK
jgi:glycosyltransferase involved in cell wall biosynthesis